LIFHYCLFLALKRATPFRIYNIERGIIALQ
jgi:hypothetical protein